MKYAFALRGSLVWSLLALSCFCGLCYASSYEFDLAYSYTQGTSGTKYGSYSDGGSTYTLVNGHNYKMYVSWYGDGFTMSSWPSNRTRGSLGFDLLFGWGSSTDENYNVGRYTLTGYWSDTEQPDDGEGEFEFTFTPTSDHDLVWQIRSVYALNNWPSTSGIIAVHLLFTLTDLDSGEVVEPNNPDNPDDPDNPDNPGTTDNPVLDVLNHIDMDLHSNNSMISGIQNGLSNWSSAWNTSQNEAQSVRVDIKNSVADFKIDVGNGFTLLASKLETGNGYSATLVNSLGEVVSSVSTTNDNLSDLVTQSALIATDTSNIASNTSDIAQFTEHIDNLLTGTGLSIYGINNAIRNSLSGFRSTTQSQLQSVNDGLTTIHDDMVSVRELTSDELELVQSLDSSVKAGNTTLSEAKQILSDNGIYLEEILGEVGEVVGYYPVAIEKADLTNQKLDESIQKQDTTNEKIDDSNEKLDDIKSESQSINTNIQNNTSILNQIDNSIQNLGDKIEAPDLSWFQEGSGNSSVGSGSVSGRSLVFSEDYKSTVDYSSEVDELTNQSKANEFSSEFNSVLSKLKNGSDSSEIVLFQLPETMGGHKIIIPSYAGFGILDNGDGSSTFIRKVLNLLGAIIGLLLCLELIEWAYRMVSK